MLMCPSKIFGALVSRLAKRARPRAHRTGCPIWRGPTKGPKHARPSPRKLTEGDANIPIGTVPRVGAARLVKLVRDGTQTSRRQDVDRSSSSMHLLAGVLTSQVAGLLSIGRRFRGQAPEAPLS
jgi:hypothetical protein